MPPYSLIPLRSEESSTQSYILAKLNNYEVCYANGCYDDAYINSHIIFIYWLYSKLWAATKYNKKLLSGIFTLHSFDSKFDLNKFLESDSALLLHKLKLEERKYARVFRALCLDQEDSDKLKDLIDNRNKILHPSGVIICNDEYALETMLNVQKDLSESISKFMNNKYIKLAEKEYGKISLYNIRNWETDYNLESYLFAKYQITQIDYDSIKALLTKVAKPKAAIKSAV